MAGDGRANSKLRRKGGESRRWSSTRRDLPALEKRIEHSTVAWGPPWHPIDLGPSTVRYGTQNPPCGTASVCARCMPPGTSHHLPHSQNGGLTVRTPAGDRDSACRLAGGVGGKPGHKPRFWRCFCLPSPALPPCLHGGVVLLQVKESLCRINLLATSNVLPYSWGRIRGCDKRSHILLRKRHPLNTPVRLSVIPAVPLPPRRHTAILFIFTHRQPWSWSVEHRSRYPC